MNLERERDVGLKLNVLTQAVNKLHANCNFKQEKTSKENRTTIGGVFHEYRGEAHEQLFC